MRLEHFEIISKSEVPQLKDIENLHILNFDAGSFHCIELFTQEGVLRAFAKTKKESLLKAVEIYIELRKK